MCLRVSSTAFTGDSTLRTSLSRAAETLPEEASGGAGRAGVVRRSRTDALADVPRAGPASSRHWRQRYRTP